MTDLPLKSDRLLKVFLLFIWSAEGEEKIARDLVVLQFVKALHQSLIGINISFMNPPQSIRSYIW
jgi:hypothetical protein